MAGPTVLVSYHVPSDLPGIIPSDPCLGQALGGNDPGSLFEAVAAAGPQWSRRPPLYRGSSLQQLFSVCLTVGQPLSVSNAS